MANCFCLTFSLAYSHVIAILSVSSNFPPETGKLFFLQKSTNSALVIRSPNAHFYACDSCVLVFFSGIY